MVTIHRESGYRFVIFIDDHEPAHVHVHGDGEMKINLVTADGLPQMVGFVGFKAADRRQGNGYCPEPASAVSAALE
jgi:Domain of unknown function (DUF4160)